MKKKDEYRSFGDVIHEIKHSEQTKDEFLKAARLQRYEKQPMSDRRLEMILDHILMTTILVLIIGGMLVFMYMMSH